ncbi:MAG: FAD:protein FMN transferase [Evtepia sp.]|uniref:FAD:protein FMN transferase n=1 Tax=Evtepia sp. TaxID=2773933 RepID=UPI002A757EAD|nr:FAD:protein FMN transferase [Evtepia sp.]MDY3014213.1 FAD:protein FMN transferase [Evtepia sp.]
MKRQWIFGLLAACLLSGCASSAAGQPRETNFFAMDTTMHFTVYGESSLLDEAKALVTGLEEQLSVTAETSALHTINRTGAGTLTGAAADLMAESLALCQRTGGALDLSIYPVVRAWGFTTGRYQIPPRETLDALLSHVDHTRIRLDAETGTLSLPAGMQIDLGSVAKGYVGRQAAQLLREHGVTSALLNLGGNIQAIGSKPDGTLWKIAVQDPNGGAPILVLSVQDQAVVTSGDYERCRLLAGKPRL